MGRPKEEFGYDMGRHIDNAIMSLELLKRDYNDTLIAHPSHPREWVRYIGRAKHHIQDAMTELRAAQKIYTEARRAKGGD